MLTHLTEQRFCDFPIHEKVLSALDSKGFEFCTPIQAQTLPITLNGNDIAGQAQTGTGKTMAFLIATFHHLLTRDLQTQKNQPRAMILAPTRELAVQIASDAELLVKQTCLKLALA